MIPSRIRKRTTQRQTLAQACAQLGAQPYDQRCAKDNKNHILENLFTRFPHPNFSNKLPQTHPTEVYLLKIS